MVQEVLSKYFQSNIVPKLLIIYDELYYLSQNSGLDLVDANNIQLEWQAGT